MFDRHQMKIYLYDDWKSDNLKVLQDIFRFLNVDETFIPDISLKYKDFRVPKRKAFHRFLKSPHPVKTIFKPFLPEKFRRKSIEVLMSRTLHKPRLEPKVRGQLIEVFREDIMKLQDLIGRDLTSWLEY